MFCMSLFFPSSRNVCLHVVLCFSSKVPNLHEALYPLYQRRISMILYTTLCCCFSFSLVPVQKSNETSTGSTRTSSKPPPVDRQTVTPCSRRNFMSLPSMPAPTSGANSLTNASWRMRRLRRAAAAAAASCDAAATAVFRRRHYFPFGRGRAWFLCVDCGVRFAMRGAIFVGRRAGVLCL